MAQNKFTEAMVGRKFVVLKTLPREAGELNFSVGEVVTLEVFRTSAACIFRNTRGGMHGKGFALALSVNEVQPYFETYSTDSKAALTDYCPVSGEKHRWNGDARKDGYYQCACGAKLLTT